MNIWFLFHRCHLPCSFCPALIISCIPEKCKYFNKNSVAEFEKNPLQIDTADFFFTGLEHFQSVLFRQQHGAVLPIIDDVHFCCDRLFRLHNVRHLKLWLL